ncbi:MAG: hypothetical protein M1820_006225 [Bogoriella megaspora]|nr:MAG: hypothetical protein M1820_006225 [Bogoriella megaspora]
MASIASTSPFPTYLVSPSALSQALQSTTSTSAPRLIPLCGTWYLPNDPQKRTGRAEYQNIRISSARFFDLDAISDTSSPYPHMLPSSSYFASKMGELGLKNDDTLVVYDSKDAGIFSAPRVAWTLKVLGHQGHVHILDNFKVWVEQGLPVEEGEAKEDWETISYEAAQEHKDKVVDFDEMRAKAKEGEVGTSVQVLDARSEGRWKGTEPEPRPGLSSGHIPGSVSVPVPELLDPKTKQFLPQEKLKELFEKKGVDMEEPVISSCGTGVTATIIDTALQQAGYSGPARRVYDGSWTEWAQRVKPEENLIQKINA